MLRNKGNEIFNHGVSERVRKVQYEDRTICTALRGPRIADGCGSWLVRRGSLAIYRDVRELSAAPCKCRSDACRHMPEHLLGGRWQVQYALAQITSLQQSANRRFAFQSRLHSPDLAVVNDRQIKEEVALGGECAGIGWCGTESIQKSEMTISLPIAVRLHGVKGPEAETIPPR